MPSTLLEKIFHRAGNLVVNENQVGVTAETPKIIQSPTELDRTREERMMNLVRSKAVHTTPEFKSATPEAELPPYVAPLPVATEVKVTLESGQQLLEAEAEKNHGPTEEEIASFDTSRFSHRVFVNDFLNEVSELIAAGQELQKVANERGASAEKASIRKTGLAEIIKTVEGELKAKLMSAFQNPEGSDLNNVFEAYTNLLNTLETASSELNTDENRVSNKFIFEIQKRKKQISDLLRIVGGSENFDKIKKAIKSLEQIGVQYASRAFRGKEGAPDMPDIVRQFLDKKDQFISDNLTNAKMITGSLDLVSILVAIETEKRESENKKN